MEEQVLPLTGKSSSNSLWQSPSDDETAPRARIIWWKGIVKYSYWHNIPHKHPNSML
jgi:hypothetical protein